MSTPIPQPRAAGPRQQTARLTAARRLLAKPTAFRVDGDAPFNAMHALAVPTNGGVYLVHDLRGVLYVGRTCDLRRRFGEHLWVADNGLLAQARRTAFPALTFSWQVLDDLQAQIELESRMIHWLDPVCNRSTPKLPVQ